MTNIVEYRKSEHMGQPLNTTGVIAARLGFPIHRVDYVIKTRGIKHVTKAGTARVYSDEQVDLIAAALRKIEKRKEMAR